MEINENKNSSRQIPKGNLTGQKNKNLRVFLYAVVFVLIFSLFNIGKVSALLSLHTTASSVGPVYNGSLVEFYAWSYMPDVQFPTRLAESPVVFEIKTPTTAQIFANGTGDAWGTYAAAYLYRDGTPTPLWCVEYFENYTARARDPACGYMNPTTYNSGYTPVYKFITPATSALPLSVGTYHLYAFTGGYFKANAAAMITFPSSALIANLPPSTPQFTLSSTNVPNPGINFNSTDPEGKNITYSYSIEAPTYGVADGTAASGAWTSYNTGHGNLSGGLHTIFIKATDADGGVTTSSGTFTLNIGNVNVGFSTPVAGQGGYTLIKPNGTDPLRTVPVNLTNVALGNYSVQVTPINGYNAVVNGVTTTTSSGTLTAGNTLNFNISYTPNTGTWNFGIGASVNRVGTTNPTGVVAEKINDTTYNLRGSIRIGDRVDISNFLKDLYGANQAGTVSYTIRDIATGAVVASGNVAIGAPINWLPTKSGSYNIDITNSQNSKTGTVTVRVPQLQKLTP